MKFAEVDGKRSEAIKGAKGTCLGCGSELIAKCGEVKINHWAHKEICNCDPWWEPETEWHRSWKNNFPEEWQEFPLLDERTREKHIADIRTNDGLVIEFQHSHIDPQERTSREKFYKKMIWVIDGTRLKKDLQRFHKGKGNFQKTSNQGIYFVFPVKCFPSAWLESSVPIILDFRNVEYCVYCLFPKQIESGSLLVEMSHESFIKNTIDGGWLNLVKNMSQFQKAWQYQMEMLKRQQENVLFQRFNGAVRYQNRRRSIR